MGQVFSIHPAVMSKLVLLSKESIAWQIMKNLSFVPSKDKNLPQISLDEVAIAMTIN